MSKATPTRMNVQKHFSSRKATEMLLFWVVMVEEKFVVIGTE